MTGRSQVDAVGYWRQFPVTAHFLEPMEINGTLIELAEHRTRDEIIPKLRIQQSDGTVVIVIAGQTRLQAELVKHGPAVGDRITITYTGEAARAAPGMNRTKEFTVAVQRPGNGNKPPAAPDTPPPKTLKVPTPVPEPVVDLEFQKVVAARLAVSERLGLLPPDKRQIYRTELDQAALPHNPAERTVEDCDRIWEILDKLDCPPIQDKLGDEPF
jgi:hypothetical protein